MSLSCDVLMLHAFHQIGSSTDHPIDLDSDSDADADADMSSTSADTTWDAIDDAEAHATYATWKTQHDAQHVMRTPSTFGGYPQMKQIERISAGEKGRRAEGDMRGHSSDA